MSVRVERRQFNSSDIIVGRSARTLRPVNGLELRISVEKMFMNPKCIFTGVRNALGNALGVKPAQLKTDEDMLRLSATSAKKKYLKSIRRPNEKRLRLTSRRHAGNEEDDLRVYQAPGRTSFVWWRARELNPRPLRCERSALPTELAPHPRNGDARTGSRRVNVAHQYANKRLR